MEYLLSPAELIWLVGFQYQPSEGFECGLWALVPLCLLRSHLEVCMHLIEDMLHDARIALLSVSLVAGAAHMAHTANNLLTAIVELVGELECTLVLVGFEGHKHLNGLSVREPHLDEVCYNLVVVFVGDVHNGLAFPFVGFYLCRAEQVLVEQVYKTDYVE